MSQNRDLSALGLAYARAVTEDLRAMVGVDISIKGPVVEWLKRDAALLSGDPMAYTVCVTKDDAEDRFHIVMSRPSAVVLASLLMGQTEDRIKDVCFDELDADLMDAFGEIMNLSNAVLSRIMNEEFSLPALRIEETLQNDSPLIDKNWLDGDDFLVARYQILTPGFDEGRLDLVFEPDLAEEWFDSAKADLQKDGGQEDRKEAEGEGSHDEESDGECSIVVIDSSSEVRSQVEDLEDELGWSVWSLDPVEFDPEDMDEFLEVKGFFIEWLMDVRCGVDFVELLRHDERTVMTPILVAMEAPTERMVRAALSAGADTVVKKPYAMDEMMARLPPLMAEARRKASSRS